MTESKKNKISSNTAFTVFQDELRVLIPELFELQRQYEINCGEDNDDIFTFEEEYGLPCSEKEIAALEKKLKSPLPPGYRAFFSLYGKRQTPEPGFDGILGLRELKDEDIQEELSNRSELFDEFEDYNPLKNGAIPFILAGRQIVLLLPPALSDGEMEVVDYDIVKEEHRFPNLVEYFRYEVKTWKRILKKARSAKKSEVNIRSIREAIDLVLKQKPSPATLKEVERMISGWGDEDGLVPEQGMEFVEKLHNAEEAKQFLEAIRPVLKAETADALASGALTLLERRRTKETDKCFIFMQLFFNISAPAKKNTEWRNGWLININNSINIAVRKKHYDLAASWSDSAKKYIRENPYIAHNAACAYAFMKRYDDALEMCRLAVKYNYEMLDLLKNDKDLGPLRGRHEFNTLFTGEKSESKKVRNRS